MMTKPQWLQTWQTQKAEVFRAEGFPTRKTEDWKYTNIGIITENTYRKISSPLEYSPHSPETLTESYLLLVQDGQLRRDQSHLPDANQVKITTWSEQYIENPAWLHEIFSEFSEVKNTPFTNLNNANFNDGLLIKVNDNCILDKPIQILYLTSNYAESIEQHFHNMIHVGKNSQTIFLESHQDNNSKASFHNNVTNILVDENARLDYFKLSPENEQSLQISSMAFLQERDSLVNAYHFGLGGRLVRDDLHFILKNKGATCGLYGFYALQGSENYDCHSRIDHVSSLTNSQQLYKGIVNGKARGVFNGKIVVHKGVSKINAKQRNNNILLTKTAEINTKPELEIYSEDVSCSHGATVGELDAAALFYLRSRGIPESEAKQLLTRAFAEEVFELMPFTLIHLTERVMQKLFYSPNSGEKNE